MTGTELAPPAVERLCAEGFDARLGELGELGLPAGGFDVVSMIEVLEHVPEPDELLRQAAALLRPGGALYVTTPHARGVSGRVLGTGWSIVAPPEHLQLFSVPGLRTALGRASLAPRSVSTHAVNPYELLAAARRRRDGERFTGHVETSYKLNESLSTNRAGALARSAVNAVLNATRLGDSIKLIAERA
jgi:SAM-dependent methyltransferase